MLASRYTYRIISLAGEFMMRAIGDITINEGVNPRESTIVAGGGAAGLNIMLIASELGCENVVLPKVASALSASGMQFAKIVAEETASFVTLTSRFDRERVNATLAVNAGVNSGQRAEQNQATCGARMRPPGGRSPSGGLMRARRF